MKVVTTPLRPTVLCLPQAVCLLKFPDARLAQLKESCRYCMQNAAAVTSAKPLVLRDLECSCSREGRSDNPNLRDDIDEHLVNLLQTLGKRTQLLLYMQQYVRTVAR